MSDYYDPDGKPIDLLTWGKMFQDPDYKIVAVTEEGDIRVSTVWLGLNHGVGQPPLIFETMIFGGEHDEFTWRYSTLEAARTGHEEACKIAGVNQEFSQERII